MIETLSPNGLTPMQVGSDRSQKKSMGFLSSDKFDIYPEDKIDLSFLDPPNGPDEIGFIHHYRVIKIIGSGGMGLVFEAEDTHLKRIVAIKVMKREFVESYSSRERFLQEARAAASIESDFIVTVYQVGLAKDVPFLAMQMLHGEPLDARLEREAPLPMPEAILIARHVAEGLAHAHERGLVHRDIKPANIWLESESHTKSKAFRRAKLLDFGLARPLETKRKLTNVGIIVGTPQFMSPEQANGVEIDCRSDLFSLGTLLYVMLTGRLPFTAPTTPAMLIEIISKDPPSPSQFNKCIPIEIENLVVKLMSKQPEDRPNTAQEVVETIENILVEYSFLLPSRSSGIIGYPQRIPNGLGTKMENTVVSLETTPTLQINAMPVLYPVVMNEKNTPSQHPSSPVDDFTVDFSTLPFVPYGSSASPIPRSNHAMLVKVTLAIMALTFLLVLALFTVVDFS